MRALDPQTETLKAADKSAEARLEDQRTRAASDAQRASQMAALRGGIDVLA